ncbi:MAG: Xaa-Pro peptidase family protein [Firmicutes bacterium]|jgi:Xaa-Pro aminopeptidase|nr:Xaa-Pro peptidase family protein [Bacillota bacterium]
MLLNVKRAMEVMKRAGVEAIVATSPENVTYVSGYRSFSQQIIKATQVYAVVAAREDCKPVLVAPIGDLDCMADRGPIAPVKAYGVFHVFSDSAGESRPEFDKFLALLSDRRFETPQQALSAALKDLGIGGGRIALDSTGLTPPARQSIPAALAGYSVTEGWSLLREMRMVKTPEEVARIRTATEIAEHAVSAVLSVVHEGMTEIEMCELFNESVMRRGGVPLLTCIGVGARSSLPNVQPSPAAVKRGDIIRFDVGCVFDCYCSDIARIACLGSPSEKAARYYRAVLEGEQAALSGVRAGAVAAGIFDIAIRTTRSAGIPHYARHHCGHGIGLECYDMPSISPQDATVLEEGMVINVETPYYELGFAGLQVEDTVLVTGDGFEYLSVSDRSLRAV